MHDVIGVLGQQENAVDDIDESVAGLVGLNYVCAGRVELE